MQTKRLLDYPLNIDVIREMKPCWSKQKLEDFYNNRQNVTLEEVIKLTEYTDWNWILDWFIFPVYIAEAISEDLQFKSRWKNMAKLGRLWSLHNEIIDVCNCYYDTDYKEERRVYALNYLKDWWYEV